MSQPPQYAYSQRTNPDTRQLPPGWITQFDAKYYAWFYVYTLVQPPVATWVHPLGAPPVYSPPLGGPPPDNRGYLPPGQQGSLYPAYRPYTGGGNPYFLTGSSYPPHPPQQGGYNLGYSQPPPAQYSFYSQPPPAQYVSNGGGGSGSNGVGRGGGGGSGSHGGGEAENGSTGRGGDASNVVCLLCARRGHFFSSCCHNTFEDGTPVYCQAEGTANLQAIEFRTTLCRLWNIKCAAASCTHDPTARAHLCSFCGNENHHAFSWTCRRNPPRAA